MNIGWFVRHKVHNNLWFIYAIAENNKFLRVVQAENVEMTMNVSVDDVTVEQETWPKSGPSFNEWNMHFDIFSFLLSKVNGDNWTQATDFKYINIRADLRANGFRLSSRDGIETDPVIFLNAFEKR